MGISAGPACASPRLARDGERGRAPHRCPQCRGDFGSCRHTCAGRRPFPGLSNTQPAWVPTRTQRVPPSHPHHRAGISGEGRSLSSPEVTPSRHVRRGGNALLPKRPPGLPRGHGGCAAPAACPGQPPEPKRWHVHPSGSPCCCQPQRARARSPTICGGAPTLNPSARRFGDSGAIGRGAPTRLAGPRAEMPAGR